MYIYMYIYTYIYVCVYISLCNQGRLILEGITFLNVFIKFFRLLLDFYLYFYLSMSIETELVTNFGVYKIITLY